MDYNARGQVTRMVDLNGLITTYEYNDNSLIVRKVEPPPTGEIRITDHNGKVTQYRCDGENRTTPMLQPDGGTVLYDYDSRDVLTSLVCRNRATLRQKRRRR